MPAAQDPLQSSNLTPHSKPNQSFKPKIQFGFWQLIKKFSHWLRSFSKDQPCSEPAPVWEKQKTHQIQLLQAQLEDIPEALLCPISRDWLVNPMMTPQGYCYSQSTLQTWHDLPNNFRQIQQTGTLACPFTRAPLNWAQLCVNQALETSLRGVRDADALLHQQLQNIHNGQDANVLQKSILAHQTRMQQLAQEIEAVKLAIRLPVEQKRRQKKMHTLLSCCRHVIQQLVASAQQTPLSELAQLEAANATLHSLHDCDILEDKIKKFHKSCIKKHNQQINIQNNLRCLLATAKRHKPDHVVLQKQHDSLLQDYNQLNAAIANTAFADQEKTRDLILQHIFNCNLQSEQDELLQRLDICHIPSVLKSFANEADLCELRSQRCVLRDQILQLSTPRMKDQNSKNEKLLAIKQSLQNLQLQFSNLREQSEVNRHRWELFDQLEKIKTPEAFAKQFGLDSLRTALQKKIAQLADRQHMPLIMDCIQKFAARIKNLEMIHLMMNTFLLNMHNTQHLQHWSVVKFGGVTIKHQKNTYTIPHGIAALMKLFYTYIDPTTASADQLNLSERIQNICTKRRTYNPLFFRTRRAALTSQCYEDIHNNFSRKTISSRLRS